MPSFANDPSVFLVPFATLQFFQSNSNDSHCGKCPFPSSEMKNSEVFFCSISGRSISKGETLLLRVDFTAPRVVIEAQGSKIPPEDTLLSEMEQKSKGLFFISDVGWDFLLFYTEFLQRLSVLNWPLSTASKNHF